MRNPESRFRALSLSLALAAGLLAGCASTSIANLSSSLTTLGGQKDGLIKNGAPPPRKASAGVAGTTGELAQIDSDLMIVSEEAQAIAEDPRTSNRAAIGAWRIAVHAAWQALPVDASEFTLAPATRALALVEKGNKACASVDAAKSFSNPRDCALIRFAPAQIAHQVHWEQRNRLDRQRESGAQEASYFADSGALITEYQRDVVEKAWDDGKEAKDIRGLDTSVRQYIDDETRLFECAGLEGLKSLTRVRAAADAAEAKKELEATYNRMVDDIAAHNGVSAHELRSQQYVQACLSKL